MKLLFIAPTADGHAVGESELAYQWVSRMAERHDVTVLSYYQRAGRRLSDQLEKARVVEWAEPPLVGRHERFNAMLNPGYIPFRRRARRWIRSALQQGEHFELAHQVSPVSLRYASPLAGLGIPYVVGPVGGSLVSPSAFTAEEGGAPWFTGLRAIDTFRLRHDRTLRRSFSEAGCVVGIAEYVRRLLSDVPLRDFRILSDIGIVALPPSSPGSDRVERVRFLFVGRVVRTKGVRDAVRALSLLPPGAATFDVVGDGYDRVECENLARELGVDDTVRFHGHVPHAEVQKFYESADVFLFPSYREAGGIVVVEAMSHGLPVIVCDNGGPASTVDDESGLRVPAHDPEQYADALSVAMLRLARDPAERAAMGRAGRARAELASLWTRRVDTMESIYRDVLAAATTNPWRGQPK